ncbi:hypothetical protein GCM10008025_26720 [Ornithinibacillus halotolerans]|uniref:Prepilin type IV endopeptidase peptidase domain-containing protein n=2 Tax=Ornithinibacillus halotolerans TaxID=1274357 RepID=A0A916WB73_9BACI|nr:hypothetical protein GCM10008025_26720 [Ornithinibacillus halotolerans]
MIGFNFELLKALFLVSLCVIVFVTDMKYMLIPNKILLFFLPFFVILSFIAPLEPWWSPLVGAAAGMGIIALIIIVSRGGMGAGDMKLFGVLGIVLGLEKVLIAFFLSCLFGSVIGILLILFRIIKRKQPVPFGPYIVVATLLTYFFGDDIIQAYLTWLKI